MSQFMNIVWAFVRRDFYVATSYKFQFIFQLTAGFFIVAFFYFIAQLVDSGASNKMLSRFDTDYFSFVLIGVAAAGFLQTGLSGFAERLRTGMTEGSLEMTFSCPIRPIWVLVMPCLWAFFFEALKAFVIVLFGVFVFDANMDKANLLSCAVILLFTITSYSVFGILSASIIMVIKKGDPINLAFTAASSLIAGAYFPTDLLPSWLAWIAKILPMTYAYDGLRLSLLTGAGMAGIADDLLFLVSFSVTGLPIAVVIAHYAIAKSKRDGSLGIF
jgi:ABC-2 type transport system permease protein